jgi:hypothetical protein
VRTSRLTRGAVPNHTDKLRPEEIKRKIEENRAQCVVAARDPMGRGQCMCVLRDAMGRAGGRRYEVPRAEWEAIELPKPSVEVGPCSGHVQDYV